MGIKAPEDVGEDFLQGSAQYRADNPKTPSVSPTPVKLTPATPASNSSAGTGALPPASQPQQPQAQPDSSAEGTGFTVAPGEKDGTYDAYAASPDDGMPQKLSAISLPSADARAILDKSGAVYDEKLDVYRNVPEETIRALGAGRPTAVEYWKQMFGVGEADAVRNLNALQYLAGKKTREQMLSDNHAQTLKMQLAERPDMAWMGKGGILATFLKDPVDAMERGGESVVGDVMAQVKPAYDVLKTSLETAGGSGLAVGAVAPQYAVPAAFVGLGGGAVYALRDMQTGHLAASWAEQGIPDEQIKKYAPVAGSISAALMVVGFESLSILGKAAFLDGIAESAAAKRMMAHWMVQGGAAGGVMAAQSEVDSYLHNMAAAAAKKPQLLEDPKTAALNALKAGVGGAAFGVGAGVIGSVFGAMMERLKKPTSPSPERPVEGEPALEREGPASSAPALESRPEGENRTPTASAPASPPERSLVPRGKSSPPSIAPKGDYVKTLANRALPGGEETPEQTVSRMELEVSRFKEAATSPDLSPKQIEWFNKSIQNHEADLETLKKGPAGSKERVVEGTVPPRLPPSNWLPPGAGGEEGGPEIPAERKYVKDQELGNVPLGDPKLTAAEVLQRHSEIYNTWVTPGNQLVDQLRQEIPTADRPGIRWYMAAQGVPQILEDALEDPALSSVHDEIRAALNLSDKTKTLVGEMQQYYQEAGVTAKKLGTIKNVTEAYQNRLYEDKGARKQSMFTRVFGQNTPHAKPRVYETEFDAVRAGEKFKGDAIDGLAVYNQSMAQVNANRAVADGLVRQGQATWAREAPHADWVQTGTVEKQAAAVLRDGTPVILRYHLYAPEQLAGGIRAITEADLTKQYGPARALAQAQGTIKTGLLSWSFFHHLSMLTQAVGSGNWGIFADLPTMTEHLNSPDFKALETHWVGRGLETSMTHMNADVLKNLTDKEGPLADIANLPVVKPLLEQTDRNSQFLFGKMQRMFKVYDAAAKGAAWEAAHPDATEVETQAAEREIARYVNPTYGGLNWMSMGVTRTTLSLARLAMLAPDWATSGLVVLKQALTEGGLAGSLSRGYLVRGFIAGMAGTEALNYLRTGHFTDQNPEGHKLEIEVAPHVYTSLLRGPIGEIDKLASMTAESGLAGAARYAEGKLSPFISAVVGTLFNVDYAGRAVVPKKAGPIAGTYDILKWLLTRLTPTPIAITNLIQYLRETKDWDPLGAAGVTTGASRFSRGARERKPRGGKGVIPE